MNSKLFRTFLVAVLALGASFIGASPSNAGPVSLTVNRAGWNVVGLDSNTVTAGPNQFPQSVKICNTSTDTAAAGVSATWGWTSTNALISLDGSATKTIGDIAANSCVTTWWTVTVTRDSNAYDTSRNYEVTVSDSGSATATTGTQLVYVEHLISQNRNVVNGVTGPASVAVGETVQFVLSGSTATQGYEQIVTAPILDSSIFEVQSVVGSYAVGGSIADFYFDACSWDPAGTGVSSWACLSVGKAGGDPITVTVTAKVIGAGAGKVGGIIYDFSGSSFHYNSDFDSTALNVTAAIPTPAVNGTDDSATTTVDTAKEIDVLANDTATAGTLDPASVTVSSQPTNGTVSIDPASGKATYTPNAGHTGSDQFKYTVCLVADPTVCDEVTVNITISAPGAVSVTAVDEAKTTDVDTPVNITVLSNDSASNGTLNKGSILIVSQPSNGTVTRNLSTGEILYEPNSKFVGTDTFTYKVCSNEDALVCDEAVVTVTIIDVEESGTAANPKKKDEVIDPNEVLVIDPNTLDPKITDVDPSKIELITPPALGEVKIDPTTGEITFTPEPDFEGEVTFTLKLASLSNPNLFTFVTYTVSVGSAVKAELAQTGASTILVAPFLGAALLFGGLGLAFLRRRA